ncbi:hypothetical protein ASD62_07605 [Phycicoccus sp. Root563]|uniref:hypothetical protein n=1 Tax=Phycicoccus sp. Root563 TaxID=1736562 RepID=UPI00070316AA|nr:hypothetical protein [Phycicoccus sp. Root563]KQZ89190.1 hypothetical protein ASD62_07605 [Phycicoccus sp. Root563]
MPRPTTALRAVVMVSLVSLIGIIGVSAAAQASAAQNGPKTAPAAGTALPTRAKSPQGTKATKVRRTRPVPGAVAAATPAIPVARAMYVWDTSDAQAVVALATSRGIGQLYAAVPAHVDSSPKLAELRALVTLAQASGLRVDALGGDPGWVDNPSAAVTSWLRPALATGLFTGVHVDIEPYNTPAWTKKRSTVVTKYLATLDAFRATAGSTPLEADIPFWFNEIPANRSTFDREVMKRTDGVTVMAYRRLASGVDGSIALSANEVRAGAELGVPVRIGQETNHLGDDPVSVKQSFYGGTMAQMEVQLDLVVGAYSGSPSFAGLAIHDAIGYAAIRD